MSRPVVPPIVQSATFAAGSLAELEAQVGGDTFYSRHGNPTLAHAERLIAELEHSPRALVVASGMAAVSTTLLTLLRTGDHLVAQRDVYGATFELIATWLPRFGIEVSLVDASSPDQFTGAIQHNTKVLYVESPTNPTLTIVDLHHIVALARLQGITSVIDNTLASPVNQHPHDLGIDVVIHAATKYLAGHSDIIAGAVTTNETIAASLRQARVRFGGVLDPHAAWLLIRGLKTLELRVARQNASALSIATFLSGDARIERVCYPFHPSHPQHELALSQMAGGGGVLSFELRGSSEQTRVFVEGLHRFVLAPSLGGVESLVTVPALSTHAVMSATELGRAGVSDRLVRLAVGIEPVADLIADIRQALDRISEPIQSTDDIAVDRSRRRKDLQ